MLSLSPSALVGDPSALAFYLTVSSGIGPSLPDLPPVLALSYLGEDTFILEGNDPLRVFFGWKIYDVNGANVDPATVLNLEFLNGNALPFDTPVIAPNTDMYGGGLSSAAELTIGGYLVFTQANACTGYVEISGMMGDVPILPHRVVIRVIGQ